MESFSLRKISLLTTVLLFILALILLFSFSRAGDEKNPSINAELNRDTQIIKSPLIPLELNFSNESIPLDRTDVKEDFERELMVATYFHSNSMLMMKRAHRWFPVIEPILQKNNIPDDFKFLALIESGLDNVKSPKGAAGYWQFLKKTAQEYDLEVNDYIDERYNLQKATEAACAYFNDSFEEYKSWTLVAAAYNAGKRRITEAVAKQGQNSYYDLYLNEETSRYVFRILAAKTLLSNPTNYGFYLDEKDLYPELKTTAIHVDTTISDLVDFARRQHISYKTLKHLNFWLRSDHLPNKSHRDYTLLIPSE